MSETLLDKARQAPRRGGRKEVTSEQVDLALAWVTGEIGTNQVARVLYPTAKPGARIESTKSQLSTFLHAAVERGQLVVAPKS